MKQVKLFFFFSLSILFLYTRSSAQETIEKKTIVIKFSPLCLVDPNYPAIQVGAEFRINNAFSYQQEIGYIVRNLYKDPSDNIPSGSGIKIRSEVRKYALLNKDDANMDGLYVALEAFYTYTYFYRNGTFELDNGDECQDIYKINKHVLGMNGKIGYQKIFSSGITIDMYVGIGLKYRKINYLDKNCDGIIKYPADYLFASAEMEGEKIVFNIPMSIKLGYAF